MTPTEVARRSDALYFDCDHTHRRWLCDRIAHLEADMELTERVTHCSDCIHRSETEPYYCRAWHHWIWGGEGFCHKAAPRKGAKDARG